MNRAPQTHAVLDLLRRRTRVRHALTAAVDAVVVSCILLAVLAVTSRQPPAAPAASLAVTAVAGVSALAGALRARATREAMARIADLDAQADGVIVAASEICSRPLQPPRPIESALVHRAELRARAVIPRRAVPIEVPKRVPLAVLAIALPLLATLARSAIETGFPTIDELGAAFGERAPVTEFTEDPASLEEDARTASRIEQLRQTLDSRPEPGNGESVEDGQIDAPADRLGAEDILDPDAGQVQGDAATQGLLRAVPGGAAGRVALGDAQRREGAPQPQTQPGAGATTGERPDGDSQSSAAVSEAQTDGERSPERSATPDGSSPDSAGGDPGRSQAEAGESSQGSLRGGGSGVGRAEGDAEREGSQPPVDGSLATQSIELPRSPGGSGSSRELLSRTAPEAVEAREQLSTDSREFDAARARALERPGIPERTRSAVRAYFLRLEQIQGGGAQ